MKNEEEDYECCGYTIGPDGSEFYHCTPEILGPSSSSILELDYNRMTLEKIEVFYYWHSFEGRSIPNLELSFINWYPSRWPRKAYRLKIRCYFYWMPADLSFTQIQPLPDLNPLTSFTEHESSLEVKYDWHRFMECSTWQGAFSSINLKNEYASLEVNFCEMSFEIEKIESEDE